MKLCITFIRCGGNRYLPHFRVGLLKLSSFWSFFFSGMYRDFLELVPTWCNRKTFACLCRLLHVVIYSLCVCACMLSECNVFRTKFFHLTQMNNAIYLHKLIDSMFLYNTNFLLVVAKKRTEVILGAY